ncbi:MAG TPA: PP2C family protein-serine/threonine phosphatase [Terriglobales bacterium]|nr:PP2C family protein-serine/threonine phosphatase [Terriglobales bacterium]
MASSLPPPSQQSGPYARPIGNQRQAQRGFRADIERFWQRVTEGLALNQLWFQFRQEARTSFQLYRRDFPRGSAREQWKQRGTFDFLQELAWAFLGKLSPARRVLLLIGTVLLVLPNGGFQFQEGHRDVQLVWGDPHFWGGVLLFGLLMLEVADRVVMKRDLEIARDIQSWLLPSAPPNVPGLAIAFATRPANTVAGDFYDVFPRIQASSSETHFLIAVADVAGKSIPAALLMATFQASLKTLSSTPCSLLELVAGMNRYACNNSQGGLRFTTAFLAEYNPGTRAVTYVNAGHNNPILRRSSGAIERLETGGLPLGIQPDAAYSVGEVSLAPGDWLAIFTDGLVEAENASAQEYGEERLLTTIQMGGHLAPEALLQQMISNVNNFVGTTPQHDDVTCVLIKAI